MTPDAPLPADELFARLEREFERVGTGIEGLVTVDRWNAGPPPPDLPPPPDNSVSWDIGGFRLALEVLQSLPDGAGTAAFVDAMIVALKRGRS